jgi:Kef-type K+ transport system membrane component KefB
MNTRYIAVFYLGVACLIGLIFFVLSQGSSLELAHFNLPAIQIRDGKSTSTGLANRFVHPIARVILEIIVILLTAKLCRIFTQKIGQPGVVGDIIAGIILGPSVLGNVLPGFTTIVFPPESLGSLQILSEFGLILFMFVIGMELDVGMLRNEAGVAVVISHASIVIPFLFGVILSCFLYKTYGSPNISFHAFALFIGIAMSITAFPVLASILRERGLFGTRLGSIAITCAAADDITAWCLLAIVVAFVKAGSMDASLYVLLFAVIYVAIMFFVVKPVLKRLLRTLVKEGVITPSSLAVIFLVLLISAYCSEIIGIHVLFGAFVAGIIMPDDPSFRKLVTEKIEDFALILLLPIFFAYTGLRTQIGLLNNISLWIDCSLIIFIAIAGKFLGSALAARIMGESAKDSLAIGVLMNTRGLVELVVLNIGYELGVLNATMFTMLVLMALVTTFMTSPVLNIIYRRSRE